VTIAARRRTYWVLFAFSCVCSVAAVALTIVLPRDVRAQDLLASTGVYEVHSVAGISISSLFLVCLATAFGALFSIGALGTVLASFRKTVSPEIYFFAVWVASIAFETLRPLGLFLAVHGATLGTQLIVAKVQLWARYAGLLALFVSGLHAAGMRNDKPLTELLLVLGIAVGLASLMPMNSGVWDANLSMKPGYFFLNEGFYIGVSILTVVNYFVAVRMRSDKSFLWAALGIGACLSGSRILFASMVPLTPLLALAFLAAGSALFIWKMHSYYLWQ